MPPPDPAPRAALTPRLAALVAGAFLLALWALVAPAPFLSEDWTQLAEAREHASLAAALDPAREPLRPVQHAWFWVLGHSRFDPAGGWLPALARLDAFVVHGLACAALYALARAARFPPARAAAVMLVFALFPNVKMLAWPAAIGGPVRIVCELAALGFFARRLSRGGAASGPLGLACFALALGSHEGAILLPAIALVWAATAAGGTWRQDVLRGFAALRDPWLLGAFALSTAHVVHLALLRPQRHHGVKSLDALPANVVKAALSLAPEWLREIGVEGLRGQRGALGALAGGLVLLLVAVAFVLALRRGGLLRFAALAIALDLSLAVVGAGFVQRYAGLAAAFAALGLVAWARTAGRALCVAALAAFWAHDAAGDAREIRRAGGVSLSVAEDARAARARAGPWAPIAIVGLPDMAGSEADVPWFNWGAAEFLAAHGAAGPWILWRERPFRTSSDVQLVTPAEVERVRAAGVPVLEFDGSGLRLRGP